MIAELAKFKTDSEAQKKSLENELSKAKREVEDHQTKITQMGESSKTLLEQIENLKKDLKLMRDHYESVQEDFVLKNSKLSTDKEDLERSDNLSCSGISFFITR